MPSAPAMASSSLDLERLMADLIPKLTPTKRRELRYLVRGLKTRKVIGGIPSVSAALVARAPALVGAHLWRSCIEKRVSEPNCHSGDDSFVPLTCGPTDARCV